MASYRHPIGLQGTGQRRGGRLRDLLLRGALQVHLEAASGRGDPGEFTPEMVENMGKTWEERGKMEKI